MAKPFDLDGVIEQARREGRIISETRPVKIEWGEPQAPEEGESETNFQQRVIELAQLKGWTVAHFRSVPVAHGSGDQLRIVWQTPVQADGAGFPDLVLVRERILFVELKTDVGKLSLNQEKWQRVLKAAGANACVWRPGQWNEITGELA